MKAHESWIGSRVRSCRGEQLAVGIQQPLDRVRYAIPRRQDCEIVIHRQEAPVEHPMNRPAKRQTIADGIRPRLRYWMNMGRLNFGATAAIDYLQAREGAGIFICGLDGDGKSRVPERSRDHTFNDGTFERDLVLGKTSHCGSGRRFRTQDAYKTRLQNPIVLCIRNGSYCSPECTLACTAIGFAQGGFVVEIRALAKGNRPAELEISRHKRVKMIWECWMLLDRLDPRGCEIDLPAAAATGTAIRPTGFIIYNPVTGSRFHLP